MIHCIVLAKQVPDTARITGDVMKDDGTVDRGRLPAVLNPEDRVALEVALLVKERWGARVDVISMGPPRAVDVLRECLSLGADAAFLVTDRRFAGSDTLATSYVLAQAIRKLAPFDLVLAGRQAIDGDTAQVGPQTAEKLGIAQVTCADRIVDVSDGHATIRHRIDGGCELLQAPLPLLLTVVREAAEPRPPSIRRTLVFKRAHARWELERQAAATPGVTTEQLVTDHATRGLLIETLTADDLELDPARCGSSGSPTKVHRVRSVVLTPRARVSVEATTAGLGELVRHLKQDRILA